MRGAAGFEKREINPIAAHATSRTRDASGVVEQRETKFRVRSVSLDTFQCRLRLRRQTRKLRIVLDLAERALSRQTDFDAGIQNPDRVECILHRLKTLAHIARPDGAEQRRAKSSVAMLACERSAKLGGQRDDVVQNAAHPRPPVRLSDVDEGIHMDVRIARVPEDHAARFVRPENCADAAHIGGEIRRRNRAVLDELHRAKIRIEPGEDRTGGVSQLPKLRLGRAIERHASRRRAAFAKNLLYCTGSDGRAASVIRLDLGKQR